MTISVPGAVTMADRFVLQQTWWIVSELVRRHPDMWVKRYLHAEGGWLVMAHTPDAALQVVFDLHSGIQVHEQGIQHFIPWVVAFNQNDAHTVVRKVESVTTLGKPMTTPSTAAHSLTYRLIAQLLAIKLDDRRSWNAIEVELDPILQGDPPEANPLIRPFPTVLRDVKNQRDEIRELLGPDARLRPYLWTVVHDLEPLFVLDADGFVHTRDGLHPTMEIYAAAQHDISRAAAVVLQLSEQERHPRCRGRTVPLVSDPRRDRRNGRTVGSRATSIGSMDHGSPEWFRDRLDTSDRNKQA